MVALGPRVGGAHVDVNLKMDSSSLDTLAKRIHSQLTSIGNHNRDVYQGLGREAVTAWRASLGAAVVAAPHIGALISGLAGGATLLAGSLYSVGQSTAGLLPVLTSLGVAGLTASIGMNNFFAAVSETSAKGLQDLLKGMPKSMQAAVLSTRALSNEMRAAIWPKLFAGLTDGIDKLRETGVIQRGLGLMADQMNGLAKSVLNYANSKEGVSTLNKFFANNAKVFGALGKAVVPFLDAFLRLINALTPSAIRLAGHITDLAKHFQDLTKADGFGKRIDDAMKKAEKTAGLLLKVLGNLGSAIINVFNITNPATNTFLQMLVGVTQRFKDFTESAKGKNSIAEWAMNSVKIMGQLGETIRSVFRVLGKLASPEAIIQFLKTLQGAFDWLNKLPLEKIVTAFVNIAEQFQPISEVFLAFIIGSTALSILFGNMLGQLGGVYKGLDRLLGIGDAFKGIGGSAGKHAKEVSKFTRILGGLGSILGKALKFAGLAGLAVYIASLILKSDKLKGKVGEAFQAFKDLAGPLVDAFTEIKTALGPVTKGLSPVFKLLDKIASIGIGLILDTITYAFKSLGKVIEGAGHIIAGVINFFTGLFTLDGSKMLDGLKQIASGILPLLQGLFGLFITFFAPARLLKLGALAFKGLFTGIKGAIPGILSGVASLLGRILEGVTRLAPKLLVAGGRAIASLAKSVVHGAPGVLLKVGKLYLGIIKWIALLPGKLLKLGIEMIGKLGGAVVKGTPRLLEFVGKLEIGIVKWIALLPGKLLKLGIEMIQKLGGAIRGGVGKMKTAAGKIFDAIWNAIKDLPGQMLDIGKNIIGGIIDGIKDKLGPLGDMIGKAASVIKDHWPFSPVKEGPLKAWNYGGGATGGGRKVIEALAGGLEDISPIRRAMADVASAVSGSIAVPTVSGGTVGHKRTDTGRVSESASGGNIYIGKMQPHNYGEFERQVREKSRLAALGGRRPVVA